MDPKFVRAARKHLHTTNKAYTKRLELVPVEEWQRPAASLPITYGDRMKLALVWRSSQFLVQVLEPLTDYAGEVYRVLGVNRTAIDDEGKWVAGITWDELMECKRGVGYSELSAVEAYPADSEVVNVANIRWLWILKERPDFFWRQ